jgi:hypothetical protein
MEAWTNGDMKTWRHEYGILMFYKKKSSRKQESKPR